MINNENYAEVFYCKFKSTERPKSHDKSARRQSQDRSRKDYNKSSGRPRDNHHSSSDRAQPPRHRSDSRNDSRPRNDSRSRPPVGPPNLSRSRNSSANSAYSRESQKSTDSFPSQMRSLQNHTSHSKSSRKHEKGGPVNHMHRSKSPGTIQSLKNYYFIPGQGHKEFKNWRQLKKCLRCFSDSHLAKDCHIHREPVREPCRLCVHLFHKTERCHIFSLDGTKRRSSKK